MTTIMAATVEIHCGSPFDLMQVERWKADFAMERPPPESVPAVYSRQLEAPLPHQPEAQPACAPDSMGFPGPDGQAHGTETKAQPLLQGTEAQLAVTRGLKPEEGPEFRALLELRRELCA
jgi:hypothetical protein